MTTKIHDSNHCDCEMCHFAREFEKSSAKLPSESLEVENQPAGFLAPEPKNASEGEYGAGVTISTPDFDHEWEAAPRGMTNYVERSIAEYFYLRGRRAGGVKSDDRGESRVSGDG